MKKFIVGFTKVIPWVYIVAGLVMVLANPPRRANGDEDPVTAILMLLGVIVSSLLFFAFSYVVEAAYLYLEENKKNSEND